MLYSKSTDATMFAYGCTAYCSLEFQAYQAVLTALLPNGVGRTHGRGILIVQALAQWGENCSAALGMRHHLAQVNEPTV